MEALKAWLAKPGNSGRGLSRELGLSPSAVQRWIQRNHIPAERVVEIERVTGVPRQALRPDLYSAKAA